MKPLSLTMLQNVFYWGANRDKPRVKNVKETKRLSVAGAAEEIKKSLVAFCKFQYS